MEADSGAVLQRVAVRTDDIPLGEQTVAQVSQRPLPVDFALTCSSCPVLIVPVPCPSIALSQWPVLIGPSAPPRFFSLCLVGL